MSFARTAMRCGPGDRSFTSNASCSRFESAIPSLGNRDSHLFWLSTAYSIDVILLEASVTRPLRDTVLPAGFAASGTCVTLGPAGRAWIGTGAADTARVLVTIDEGRTWTAIPSPLPAGEAAGIFTIAFRDSLNGVILGGDLSRPDEHTDNVAATDDGGVTWHLSGRPVLAGAVYGAAYVPGAPTPTLVAVGPNGAAWSPDEGRTWSSGDTASYWGLDIAGPAAGWLVGPEGRIVRISFE